LIKVQKRSKKVGKACFGIVKDGMKNRKSGDKDGDG